MELSQTENKEVYPNTKSHQTFGSYPLVVINEGTKEWDGPAGDLAARIPAEEVLQHLLDDPSHQKGRRGNIQLNYGIAGGQSHAKRSPETIVENAGTAFPSWLKDSRSKLVQLAMRIGTQIAELLNFPWMSAQQYPHYERRLAMGIHRCLGSTDIKLEHCTFFYNKIDGTKCIKEHGDDENCRRLPNVLTYAKLVQRDDG